MLRYAFMTPDELTTAETAAQLGVGRRRLQQLRAPLRLAFRRVLVGRREHVLYQADSVGRAAVRRAAERAERGARAQGLTAERQRVARITRSDRREVERLAWDLVRVEHGWALANVGADVSLHDIPKERLPRIREALLAALEMKQHRR